MAARVGPSVPLLKLMRSVASFRDHQFDGAIVASQGMLVKDRNAAIGQINRHAKWNRVIAIHPDGGGDLGAGRASAQGAVCDGK